MAIVGEEGEKKKTVLLMIFFEQIFIETFHIPSTFLGTMSQVLILSH